jgi:hypothetical protein
VKGVGKDGKVSHWSRRLSSKQAIVEAGRGRCHGG